MSSIIEKLEREQLQRLPDFQAGDRVRVHLQVVEGSRRRTQVFEGIVIARSGHGVRETVTVRKQSFGVGVERVFPLHSPKIEKIEVAGRGDVRRAKLYYLRDRIGRKARVRERTDLGPEQEIQRELLEGPRQDGDPALEDEVAADAVEAVDGDAPEVAAADESTDATATDAPDAEAQADGGDTDGSDDAPAGEADAPADSGEADAAPEAEVDAGEEASAEDADAGADDGSDGDEEGA